MTPALFKKNKNTKKKSSDISDEAFSIKIFHNILSEDVILVFFVCIHFDPLWPSSQSPATCTVPTWACPYPYHKMTGTPFPIMLCLHLTHQTVAVPAARAPAQITTRQLIELFFSSQAGGHCKNIPTLEYGFLVQVRHLWHMTWLIKPAIVSATYLVYSASAVVVTRAHNRLNQW